MSDQDMQFADPEWRPPEQRDVYVDTREQKTAPPQPINADRREQPPWQTVPPPQQGYMGPGYAASQPQTMWGRGYGQRPYRSYRRRSPWLWIILPFILLALMSGVFNWGFGGFGPHKIVLLQKTLTVGRLPTIQINGGVGDINVSTGSSSTVTIEETTNGGGPDGNPRDKIANPDQNENTNTITVNLVDQGGNFGPSRDVNLDITVPTDTNLHFTTTDGSIEVDGVNGQMTLQSSNGDITANNDVLTGSSTLSSYNGSVTFRGSIGSGNYQFLSNNGSVDVTLPSNSNFYVDASTNTGSIDTNDFSTVNNTGSEAHGNVGNFSQATVTLRTETGSINLKESS